MSCLFALFRYQRALSRQFHSEPPINSEYPCTTIAPALLHRCTGRVSVRPKHGFRSLNDPNHAEQVTQTNPSHGLPGTEPEKQSTKNFFSAKISWGVGFIMPLTLSSDSTEQADRSYSPLGHICYLNPALFPQFFHNLKISRSLPWFLHAPPQELTDNHPASTRESPLESSQPDQSAVTLSALVFGIFYGRAQHWIVNRILCSKRVWLFTLG
jgi:hypothetical protein